MQNQLQKTPKKLKSSRSNSYFILQYIFRPLANFTFMKILYISPRYEGGIGGHAKRVAEKLREKDYDIKLMFVPHVPIKNLKILVFYLLDH